MASTLHQLEQAIAAAEQESQRAAAQIYAAYRDYLRAIASASRQRLVLAAYHVCTRNYPQSFLKLSLSQRQALQKSLRHLGQRLETQTLALLAVGSASGPSDRHTSSTVALPEAVINSSLLSELETKLRDQFGIEIGTLPKRLPADAPTDSPTNAATDSDLSPSDASADPAAPESDPPADADPLTEAATSANAANISDHNPAAPHPETTDPAAGKSPPDRHDPAGDGRSPTDLANPPDHSLDPAQGTPDRTPDSAPDRAPDRTPDRTFNPKPNSESNSEPNSEPDSEPNSEPDSEPDPIPEGLPAEVAQVPHRILMWLQSRDHLLLTTLQTFSHKANRLLHNHHILPRKLPGSLFEIATQADLGADRPADAPSLLDLTIATGDDDDEGDRRPTRLVAIHLRPDDLHLADASVARHARHLRTLVSKLESLAQRYDRIHRQLISARAEAAWRSSWFDDDPPPSSPG
jgi:hypothetical protein